MTIAGLINMSMLVMAAAVFHCRGLTGVEDIDEVFDRLGDLVGSHAQIAFGVALLASGLSSSSVGTLAGQVVMQGFIRPADPAVFCAAGSRWRRRWSSWRSASTPAACWC